MNTVRLITVIDSECHQRHRVRKPHETFTFDIDHKKNFIGCKHCNEIIATLDLSSVADDVFDTDDPTYICQEITRMGVLNYSYIDNYMHIIVTNIMINDIIY